jgi:hypothetical protein
MQVENANVFDAAGQGEHLKGPEASKNTEGDANTEPISKISERFAFACALHLFWRRPESVQAAETARVLPPLQ